MATDDEPAISVTSRLFDDEGQPNGYPICAECKAAFVYRWAMRLSGPSGFYWFRDCKHKTADIEMHTKDEE